MVRMMLVLCVLGLFGEGTAQQVPAPDPVFSIGEELQYSVCWRFLRIGTITVQTVADPFGNDSGRVRVVMIVQSNPDLPVISLQEHNEAIMDIVQVRSLSYTATHVLNGEARTIRHSFDPASRSIAVVTAEIETGDTTRRTISDVDWYVEGTSLFFFARALVRQGGEAIVPTLVNGVVSGTTLRVDPQREDLTIDALNRPVRAKRFFGTAEWTGGSAAGVTGDFVGWVSDDQESVLLRAELEIVLGSIDIELERWRREGWNPPLPQTVATR